MKSESLFFLFCEHADGRAREKGVLLLGECGLDPGIDSMYVFFTLLVSVD
jgi:saccharopine dehydrogenase-like NADP-dependent oxidoreductase